MKTAFFLIIAGLGVLWFADETIQAYGLMVLDGEKWTGTTFVGWSMFKGIWFLWVAVAAAVALFIAGIVAWLRFDFEEREKELKAQLDAEKQVAIRDIVSNVDDRVDALAATQHRVAQLTNRISEMEKSHSVEIKRMDGEIKGKQEQVRRLRRKIEKMEKAGVLN
ncbi:hypothetical protein JYT55_01310 [Mariprofundus ferrooxydans]|nr:hypothetical protein [Mariprofundus ferrooxydans]